MLLYETAQKIVENNPDVFYENHVQVNGYDLSLFTYFLASYKDFNQKYAKELRGLCFLSFNDKKIPFLSLHKFFNVNENEDTDINILKNKKVKSIQDKSDGSLISFVMLPDSKIVAKSKMSFESDQAKFAQHYIDNNKNFHDEVYELLMNGCHPLFEYVAPENQVVLGYDKAELILLQIRNKFGEYFEAENLKEYAEKLNVNYSEPLDITFEECLELVDTLEDKEGWVIRFDDDMFVKLKTKWYLNLHGTISNVFLSNHTIAQEVINETIDDFISSIPNGSTKEYVHKVHEATLIKYDLLKENVKNILEEIWSKNIERKYCYDLFGNTDEFSIVMNLYGRKYTEEELDKSIRKFMLKKLTKNEKAKEFLNIK